MPKQNVNKYTTCSQVIDNNYRVDEVLYVNLENLASLGLLRIVVLSVSSNAFACAQVFLYKELSLHLLPTVNTCN